MKFEHVACVYFSYITIKRRRREKNERGEIKINDNERERERKKRERKKEKTFDDIAYSISSSFQKFFQLCTH